MVMMTETDSFVAALRTQSQRYHSLHPFHLKMNEGGLSRRQIRGPVTTPTAPASRRTSG
jgi:pyrroloquinoline quinone (PQQ) biosynthesis protein C